LLVITLVLPYPISANRYWTSRAVTKTGASRPMVITHPSSEAQAYKREVMQRCFAAGVLEPLRGRVGISVQLFPNRPLDFKTRMRKHGNSWDDTVMCLDLDNANKVLLDSLKGVAIEDDKWVRELISKRMEPDGEGRVVVRIVQLEVPNPQLEIV
jgi:crossover junction endodeoxyribonuclease RusA